jgi:hypothetical protein
MSPLNKDSFWMTVMRPYCVDPVSPRVGHLLEAVDQLFAHWRRLLSGGLQPIVSQRPYLLDDRPLTFGAGIIQIRDYAKESDDQTLLRDLSRIQEVLKSAKAEFFELLTTRDGLDYFGPKKLLSTHTFKFPTASEFEKVLAKRLAVASLLVDRLQGDPNFGRTKFAKIFYLSDIHGKLDLKTEYFRAAAGPLDQRALYNEKIGIESLAQKYSLFSAKRQGNMIRYNPGRRLEQVVNEASVHLNGKVDGVKRIANLFRNLNTDQSEIIATLYACWNDFLLQRRKPTDEEIANEFLEKWHPKKTRFPRSRLLKGLLWMRDNDLIPSGIGTRTSAPRESEN